MVDRARLALAIPTYKRAAILADNLARMHEDLRRLGIPVYVSDDSPDDEVQRALLPFRNVHYRRNVPALGHDGNLPATLFWPQADYVWLLGDSRSIAKGQLDKILAFLQDQDLLFVNSHSDNTQMISSRCGEAARELMREMLWHQTMTGTTIFHRRVCDWASDQGESLTIKPDFPQLSIMLGYAAKHRVCTGWFGEPSIHSNSTPSYWHSRTIPVFADHWAAVVEAFPDIIPPKYQSRVIRSHSARMNLFRITVLLDARLSGAFNWRRLRERRFRDAMHLPLPILVAILFIPRFLVVQMKRAEEELRRRGISNKSSLRDVVNSLRKAFSR